MKLVSIIVIVILALALMFETGYLVNQIGNQKQLSNQVLRLEQDIQGAKNDNGNLVNEINGLNNEVNSLNNEIKGLSSEITLVSQEKSMLTENVAQLEQEVTESKDEKSKLEEELKTKSDQVKTLTAENVKVKSKFMCLKTLTNVDFSTNESVNKSLKKFVADSKGIDEPVSASYWNLIWTRSKYSIHTVEVHSEKDNMNYIWKFTVYFRGESYGDHENGIFYNDDQCWMYLDK